jgi:spore coat polysaccharide biosynthesis predicted glycosyltransferase SpsG
MNDLKEYLGNIKEEDLLKAYEEIEEMKRNGTLKSNGIVRGIKKDIEERWGVSFGIDVVIFDLLTVMADRFYKIKNQ